MDFNILKRQVLERLDIQAEYQRFAKIEITGPVQSTGWVACKNPFASKDNSPSAGICVDGSSPYAGYLKWFNIRATNRVRSAISFWDACIELGNPAEVGGVDFVGILKSYAKKVGIDIGDNETGKKKTPPPSEDKIRYYIRCLTPEVMQFLREKRGLSDETINDRRLGWSSKRQRNAIPIYDADGELVNIKYHSSKLKPKALNYPGFGDAKLYGADRLAQAAPGSTIIVTEGEFDSMLAEQETGYISVSPTNGVESFMPQWAQQFIGKNVVLLYDSDEPGRKAVYNKVLPQFRKLVLDGKIEWCKVVWLYEQASKDRKDFTDWIIRSGGSGQQLRQIIDGTDPYLFPDPTIRLPEPKILDTFIQIDNTENAGVRVTVPLFVFGENTEAYHGVTELTVQYCPLFEKSACSGRKDWNWLCGADNPIRLSPTDPIQLSCAEASNRQVNTALQQFVCDKNRKPHIQIDAKDRFTFRGVFAHQRLIPGSTEPSLIEKETYFLGGDLLPIGNYLVTGTICSRPRDQKPVLFIDEWQRLEEDWQGFKLNARAVKLLGELKELGVRGVIDDLASNVTKILKRRELHVGVLLTMVSPRRLNFLGERIRGWICTMLIGDTSTGKTYVSQRLFDHAKVGYRVSGMTSSRTGITYACEHDTRRGWRIKAGAVLKMSRQALIIDEAQDVEMKDLKTMAEGMDTGELKIDRIQNRIFETQTRCLFSCNPKPRETSADQRIMDSYRHGCESLFSVFPKMMIRRTDLCMFASSSDIDSEEMNTILEELDQGQDTAPKVSSQHLQTLVHYAWNLPADQIIFPRSVASLILTESIRLSAKFGGCSDLPIVCPSDFRLNLARLSAAFAVLSLSSEDDFQTIVVQKEHVDFVTDYIDRLYSADNCRLDRYARKYEEQAVLIEPEQLADALDRYMDAEPDRRYRVCKIVDELLKIEPMVNKDKLSQKYFADRFDKTRQTIRYDMALLVQSNLVESARGYRPTTKLVKFANWLDRNRPGFFGVPSEYETEL